MVAVIKGDDGCILGVLLKDVLKDLHDSCALTAIVNKRHVNDFLEHGFVTFIEFKKYNKMWFTGRRDD